MMTGKDKLITKWKWTNIYCKDFHEVDKVVEVWASLNDTEPKYIDDAGVVRLEPGGIVNEVISDYHKRATAFLTEVKYGGEREACSCHIHTLMREGCRCGGC